MLRGFDKLVGWALRIFQCELSPLFPLIRRGQGKFRCNVAMLSIIEAGPQSMLIFIAIKHQLLMVADYAVCFIYSDNAKE